VRAFRSKHLLWLIFGLLSLLVFLTRDIDLLHRGSLLRQRYAPFPWLMLAHGVPGALALTLGVFQFSDRLRARFLKLHRALGYIYVVSAMVAAPAALVVSRRLATPTLFEASSIQALAWIFTTAIALYCVRTGRIQQHREWMTRSYCFAAVFVVTRAVGAIPAIARMGETGVITVVWSTIALAGIVPSFVIALQNMPKKRVVAKAVRV
jgi:uncharacterized membrane protein